MEKEEELGDHWASWQSSHRNSKGSLGWAFLNSVQEVCWQLTEKQGGRERLHCSQQFSAVNLFASQTLSLKEVGFCLEIAAETNKDVFFWAINAPSYWHIQARTANGIIWAPTHSLPSTFPEARLLWTTRGSLPAAWNTPTLPCSTDCSGEMKFQEDANVPFGDVLNLALFTVISVQLTSLFKMTACPG